MFSVLVTSTLLGVIAFLVCLWLIRRPRNLPPGPWGLPLLGYRLGRGPGHEEYAKLAKKYGPIFSLRKGPYLTVVLNDSASVRQAMLKQGNAFSHRFVPAYNRPMIPASNKDASVLWGSGKAWTDLRRFCMSTLRTFGMGKKSLEPQINLEARELCEEIQKHGGRPVNLTETLTKATGNIINQLVIGRRYDYDNAQLEEIVKSFYNIATSIPHADLAHVFPFLILHSPAKRYVNFRDGVERIHRFALTQLETHRKNFQTDNIRDLCDAFFADDDASRMYSLDEFWRVLFDLFGAGMETTSSTLSWAIICLTIYPDIQRKVQAELDNVVGHGRQPTMGDRPDLPYCHATLMEVMRIHPVVPNALPHMAAQTVSLGDYVIPKGTIVLANLWAVHHDPDVWKNPDAFDPERFLAEGGRAVERNDAWMPFGVGPRECLGAQLAKMEAFLLFTNLFQRFEFKLPSGQIHDLTGVHGITSAPQPYEICAIER